MQLIQIPIDRIHPDPNQPRKNFDSERINELAQSIISEGIINPIEVDDDNMIITGETRWRAARMAKLKTVPCKRISAPDPKKRFQRQVIENIQQNSLCGWDTALAIAKMLELSPEGIQLNQGVNTGVRALARTLGKSPQVLFDSLNLLTASKPIQDATKKHVKSGGLPTTITRALVRTPKEFKPIMEKKILAHEFSGRDSAIAVAKALTDYPQKAKELLAYDYSKCDSVVQTAQAIGKVLGHEYSSLGDELDAKSQRMKDLVKIANSLFHWFSTNNPESIEPIFLRQIVSNVLVMKRTIEKWLANEKITAMHLIESEVKGKLIEGQIVK